MPWQLERDVEYAVAEGQSLKLDLYRPEDSAESAAPLVVWIHGGGWRGGSRAKPPIRDIVRKGFALASISYRFTDQATFPAQIHDCKAAIRFLRANAKRFGYDASRITVAGSSAGGYLALMLGVTGEVPELEGKLGEHLDTSSRVQAIVNYFGPSDFVLRGRTQPERAYTEKSGSFALLGGRQTGKLDPDMEKQASPVTYVDSQDPPLLTFHGAVDETVLLDQAERIHAVYESHDLDSTLIVLESAKHGGAKFFRDVRMEQLLAFLHKNH